MTIFGGINYFGTKIILFSKKKLFVMFSNLCLFDLKTVC